MNPLPPEFDAAFYRSSYPDLFNVADTDLEHHYQSIGVMQGRVATPTAIRANFVALPLAAGTVLEIGPLANPVLTGPNVRYFDVLPTEALRQKAAAHGLDPARCPTVDFVSPTGDLSVVNTTFDAVFSSHVLEHQPDLSRHLIGVGQILRPSGCYYLAVPDKRYCFDHFIAESTIAQVIDAAIRRPSFHTSASVIEHLALTTHNDPAQHWRGHHGEPAYRKSLQCLREAITICSASTGTYIDTHAWQFVPDTFREITRMMYDLGLSPLYPVRVYQTIFGSNEFYAVLQHAGTGHRDPVVDVPADFDDELYLQANPDVAAAGVNARYHYVTFGRAEGRRLRLS